VILRLSKEEIPLQPWGGRGSTNSGNAKGGETEGRMPALLLTFLPAVMQRQLEQEEEIATAGGNSSFTSLVIAAGDSSTTTITGGAGGNWGDGTSTTGVRGGGGGGAANLDPMAATEVME
jgi:hypothetical protein